MAFKRRFSAQAVFFAGLILMVSGVAFLLGSMEGVSRLSVLGSFLIVIIGAFLAVLAIKLNKKAVYLFFAAFFMLMGFFLFLSALGIIPFKLAQSWPVISVFAGLALFPAGFRHYRAIRIRYLIPSLAFVILGCVLLVFSFHMVSFSFKRFMVNWWPLILVMCGLTLLLLSLGSKNKSGE